MLRVLLCFSILLPAFAHADAPATAGCGGDVECGYERNIGVDDRVAPVVEQPVVTTPTPGSCGKNLPLDRSYQAIAQGVSCSAVSGGIKHYNRLPLDLPKEMRYAWIDARDSGSSDSRFKMQQARKQEYKWTDQAQTNVSQSWTWQKKVGGYKPEFGTEEYKTTCSVSRTRHYTTREYRWVEDRRNCIRYEEEDDDSSSSSGGNTGFAPVPATPRPTYNRRSQDYDTPSTPNYNSGVTRKSQDYTAPKPAPRSQPRNDTGYGESKRSSKKRWDGSMNEYQPQEFDANKPTIVLVGDFDRSPTRACAAYGQKKEYYNQPHSDPMPDYTYDCMKTRNKWGTWFVTQPESDTCGNQNVNLSYQFVTSPNWKPGYKDSAPSELRDYHDSLPNQWDLLPGETETVTFEPESGGRSLSGNVSICSEYQDPESHSACIANGWNDYQPVVTPARCEFGKDLDMKIDIHTLGRVQRIAPNPLKVVGLDFDPLIKSHPTKLVVQDTSRITMLDAAENSRTFRTGPKTPVAGASASGGYWEETRFKMALFRKVQDGKLERTTFSNEFGSDQGEVLGAKMTISLTGQTGLDRLYRPGGPFERIFGFLYKNTAVKLSPNTDYLLKVQIVQRGVPWYKSGCRGGELVCKGEVGSKDDYTAPIDIEFHTPDVDERTILDRIMDYMKARRKWGKGA